MKQIICALLFLVPFSLVAEEPWRTNIPEILTEWVPWVLKSEDLESCTKLSSPQADSVCGWYPEAVLEISGSQAKFRQSLFLERASRIKLPFTENSWPLEVEVNQQPLAVLNRDGVPTIWLEKGSYQIKGELNLEHQPPFITFPPSTGIITVAVSDSGLIAPQIDSSGRVWLKKEVGFEDQPTEQDFAGFQIFRKITDTLPAELETLIRINVGGRARELVLPDLLLGSKAYKIMSNLPARLDRDNNLFLRVSPGAWEVQLYSIIGSPFVSLSLPELGVGLPNEEIWSFQAVPMLRSVRISGADNIDPQRANLPSEWLRFPAYLIRAGQTLVTGDEKRADIKLQENQFAIKRALKLHSSGLAYSVIDQIAATIFVDGRLNAMPELDLGSVSINGVDQAITRVADGPTGVEIRTGPLELSAESRLARRNDRLHITGWQATFADPEIELYLPLGWRLLHVSGADRVIGSWVERWNLLQIFLVLTASVLALRTVGWKCGIAVAIGLVLLEQDFKLAGVVIFLIILRVLQKVITDGRSAQLLKTAKWGTILLLLFAFLPFSVQRVKTATYPQLETVSYRTAELGFPTFPALSRKAVMPMRLAESAIDSYQDEMLAPKTGMIRESKTFQNYQSDSANLVQTGYGKVELKGRSYRLSWRGPVPANESIRFFYLTPIWNLILAFAQVLLGTLTIYLIGIGSFKFKDLHAKLKNSWFLLPLCVLVSSTTLQAEPNSYPSTELLQELASYVKNELQTEPDCSPICASLGAVLITATDQTLSLSVTVQAEAETALPIIGNLKNIELQSAATTQAEPLVVTQQNGQFIAKVRPNMDQVVITALLKGKNASFSFISQPAQVSFSSQDWQLSGLDRGQAKDLSLEKIRQHSVEGVVKESAPQQKERGESVELMPLVKIERLLEFSTNWQVSTNVTFTVAPTSLHSLDLRLIEGEAVTSAGFDVQNGIIKAIFQPGQQSLSWNSILEFRENPLELKASLEPNISEIWGVNLSNLWNAQYSGTPRIQSASNIETNISQWFPRPGETLTIELTRPAGVEGPTKTINAVRAIYTVGSRLLESNLQLNLRSSIGQPHSFVLPDGAKIKQFKINEQIITSYSFANQRVEFDLSPGEQKVELSWSTPRKDSKIFSPAPLDLEAPAVNINTEVNLQDNRWILWTAGPTMGPAVLFWGLLPIVILVSAVIGGSKLTPLNMGTAILLMLGLSMQPLSNIIVIFGFLIVLGLRGRVEINRQRRFQSNLLQLLIGLWGVAAVSNLLSAIRNGLLGSPQMRIAGNSSFGQMLKWYQDVIEGLMPQVSVVSLPIFHYRLFMLLWAFWLAFAVIQWSLWCWQQFSKGGAWVSAEAKVNKETPTESS